MVAVQNLPEQTILVREAAQRVILRNISWALYQQLLAERGEGGNPRLAYNRGLLEITVTSFEHEQLNRLIADTFAAIADELEIDFINAGSTTFDRADLKQGFEPDTSFYVQRVEAVRGKKRIKLQTDPPPDLVIEIDITHPSLNKFPIYAGLGIGEIWRYHQGQLLILMLAGDEYRERAESFTLPGVASVQLTQWIADAAQTKRGDWLRSVRA